VVTDQGKAIKGRHDYLPFGEEIPASLGRMAIPGYGGTDGLRHKFTAKERDSESNLDYFLARYHSGAQGRFTSVDPGNAGAYRNDPQTWNGYSYARNNPLLYTDPTGEAIRICDNNNKNCVNSEFNPDYFERTNPNLRFSNGVINAVNEDGSLTKVGTYAEFGDAVEPLIDLTQLFRGYANVVNGVVGLISRTALGVAGPAANRALFELFKKQLRQLMEKPYAVDPELKEILRKLYREGATIGSGSTADAIRHTKATGELVGGSDHLQKGNELLGKLETWVRNHPSATPGDRAAAENVILDLRDALGK
jgi:RHS repeat-associated protein